MSNTYWFDKPQLAELEGVMLTGVRVIRKSEAVDIMNKQQEQINRFADKVISQQENIDALTQDKHTIITNHLNVLAECILAVPVPEYGREHNIKMRDSILNVMASSVAAYQVDLTHFDRMRIESKELDKKVESLDKFIKDNPIFGTLEWAEQSNMKRQLVSMISYASILKDRINLVAANREVEPSESKNIAVESLRQSIQDCEEFGRVYVELNGQWAKGHQQVTGVVVDDVGDIVIC